MISRLPEVLFIGGPSRGGSTLLDRMLGQVEGIVSVGELRYIWERGYVQGRACGCGKPFAACPFWSEVVREAFGGYDPDWGREMYDLWRGVDRPRYIPAMISPIGGRAFERRRREYTAALTRLYAAIHRISGARVVVDSSKEPASAFLLRDMPGVKLHVVHLVRDSRAVAYSWQRKKRIRPEAEAGPDEGYMNIIPPFRSAWVWNYRNFAMERFHRSRRGGHEGEPSYYLLRYEDLVRVPRQKLQHILDMLGLEGDRLGFMHGNREIELGEDHIVSGNPIRFTQGRVTLKYDDEWTRSMPPGQRRLVTAITLPYLVRYGYPWAGSHKPAADGPA